MDRQRVVDAAAPIRVCDLGGWTDTWFAGTGRILNIAVTPAVCVRLTVRPADEAAERVVLHLDGDLDGFGAAMARNTEAQGSLHPSLVGPQARDVMAAAGTAGAVGWKVNGAGGDGGSLSILAGPEPADRERLAAALTEAGPALQIIPTTFTRTGVTVTVR